MRRLAISAALLAMASSAFADTMYDITIDTSSVANSDGGLYLQFNPGTFADPASVTIDSLNLGGGSLLSTPASISDGGVAANASLASLPLTIDNSASLNDFEQFLQFGSSLSFQVTFHLPVTLSGQSGSALFFETDALDTATDAISPILTVDPSGAIGSIAYDANGNFSVDTLGNGAVLTVTPVASSVPEPGTLVLFAVPLGFCLFRLRRVCA